MHQNILISSMATNAREHFISMNISSNSARGDLISLAWQTAMTSFLPNIQIVLFDDIGSFIYYLCIHKDIYKDISIKIFKILSYILITLNISYHVVFHSLMCVPLQTAMTSFLPNIHSSSSSNISYALQSATSNIPWDPKIV